MKRKKVLPISIALVGFAAVLLGIFLVVFPDPINEKRHQIVDLDDKPKSIVLVKNENQGGIHQISIKVEGTINGEAVIKQGYSETSIIREDTVKRNINLSYGRDWYQDDFYLIYEPITATAGQIEINYKFKGMNNL